MAANFAGIPLAFAFIATLGTIGIVTQFLDQQLGWNPYDHGFTLFSKTGVELTYLYFQIPLMILVIAPAIDGLRREWREAASSLGASSWQFWRYVGCRILLAVAARRHGAPLRQLVRRLRHGVRAHRRAASPSCRFRSASILSGDVLDDPHLGQALAFGMFVVLALMMLVYIPLQRIRRGGVDDATPVHRPLGGPLARCSAPPTS